MAKAKKDLDNSNDKLIEVGAEQAQSAGQLQARLTKALATRAEIDEEINGLRNVLQGHQLATQAVLAQLQEK